MSLFRNETRKVNNEQIFLSRQMKRKTADHQKCKNDLKNDFISLMEAFAETLVKTNKVLTNFSLLRRPRSLEATVIQGFFADIVYEKFGEKASLGKYKRFVLRLEGYLVLFKKLDNQGYPMNVKTRANQHILNQSQLLELFPESNYNNLPILFFGYKKNKFGLCVKPQLIYIDNEQVQFVIDESDFDIELPMINNITMPEVDEPKETKPKLKVKTQIRKEG
ncbi:hypothetical protein Fleli_1592 [Bernardetia litoralis DSM 6794]|uniref:Uncharacterized protein n=1 Tax=Bernardetia litoralis (strain ATCC 23117 / DSM 6794 / NBRC 15988 / NCIMB 1366 / Fx l1 / Sio-4) TaxID=880071 RepID=I4AJ75_BERLS|nr:hypothetical protein [Bernardetia litoralis]AFM04010.1 hypothetical protein Fleli_1592 [Bernardetia litoralis DSM 6794]